MSVLIHGYPTEFVEGTGQPVAWTDPDFAVDDPPGQDNNFRARAIGISSIIGQANDLTLRDCPQFGGFASGKTVEGVRVRTNWHSDNGNLQAVMQLMLSGSPIGSSRILVPPNGSGDSDSDTGGPTDLWGTSLSLADVQDPTFGCRYQIQHTGGGSDTMYIDHSRITVWASGPAGGEPNITVSKGKEIIEHLGTVDAGVFSLGQPGACQLVITNTGDADLTLGTVLVTGTGFTLDPTDDPSSTVLGELETATVTVLPVTTQCGLIQAAIQIPSDDPDLALWVGVLNGFVTRQRWTWRDGASPLDWHRWCGIPLSGT